MDWEPTGEGEAVERIIGEFAHLWIKPSRLTILSDSKFANGGYGDICLAKLDGSSKIAVKQLRIGLAPESKVWVAMRLAREMRIWAKAKHPNVLELVGFYLSENYLCARLMSPYMANGNVKEYMKRTQADIRVRLRFVVGITSGMAYLHGCSPSICHGDLKPANVLVNDERDAVLCDFGLSVFVEESEAPSGLTTSRTTKGSIRYMSPELFADNQAKHTLESDIWGWGCTIFEIITDSIPYPSSRGDGPIITAVVTGQLPGSMKLLPKVDRPFRPTLDALQNLILDCWEMDPADRPSSLEILNFLGEFLHIGHPQAKKANQETNNNQTTQLRQHRVSPPPGVSDASRRATGKERDHHHGFTSSSTFDDSDPGPIDRHSRNCRGTPSYSGANSPAGYANTNWNTEPRDGNEEPSDSDDSRTYCYCNRVGYGEMIGCDDDQCQREWVSFNSRSRSFSDYFITLLACHFPSSISGVSTWHCEECKARKEEERVRKGKKKARKEEGRARGRNVEAVEVPPAIPAQRHNSKHAVEQNRTASHLDVVAGRSIGPNRYGDHYHGSASSPTFDDDYLGPMERHLRDYGGTPNDSNANIPAGPANSNANGNGEPYDSDYERKYCYCNDVGYGEMIGCSEDQCQRQWFHIGCLNMTAPPKGQWVCSQCKARKETERTLKQERLRRTNVEVEDVLPVAPAQPHGSRDAIGQDRTESLDVVANRNIGLKKYGDRHHGLASSPTCDDDYFGPMERRLPYHGGTPDNSNANVPAGYANTNGNKEPRDRHDERRYCYCNDVRYGKMIGCDDDQCQRQWFHLRCVGMTAFPKGEWVCDECEAWREKEMPALCGD